ncbi:MAG: AAA family ATPase [Patescibacteria group bacterium]
MANKIVCLVGMAGSGKSEVSEFFKGKGFEYIRFGQITLDEIKKRKLRISEKNEKIIREELRNKHGMAAYAILNMPKFDAALARGNVIGDGLYSWDEYKVLKEKYGYNLIIISIYSSPKTRYERLVDRASRHGQDEKNIFRSTTREETKKRDVSEIENLDKGGPIAMADYTIINEGSLADLRDNINAVFKNI